MMGGTWRKGDRRSSLTYFSPKYKRGNENLDRHGNKRKSIFSSRKYDGGDDFASRNSKPRYQQSRHPHQLKRTTAMSRSRSISRNSASESHDSRRCKCRDSGSRHPHPLKEEPQDCKSRVFQTYKKGKTTYRNGRGSSSDSHHKSLLPADKKQKYEERNLDEKFFQEQQATKSSSLKEFSNHFLEKSDKYLTQGNLKKALKCISLALKVCKKENKFTSKLYSKRGTIYSLLEKPRCSLQGFLDWEHAFLIDNDNIEARINMSKIFFKAANKLYRKKEYYRAMTLCNHALGLHIRNGEASILFKLLKRKLFEKELIKQSTSEISKDSPASTSLVRYSSKNLSVAQYELHEAVLDEVKRLNDLIAEALNTNDYLRALKYCDLSLRLFKSDIPDDSVYCDLLILKQQLMNSIA